MNPLLALVVPIVYMLVMEGVLLLRAHLDRRDREGS